MSKSSLTQLLPTHFVPHPTPSQRDGSPAPRVGLGLWNLFKAMRDVPEELSRMADEYETTRPELSKRLRRTARQGWGW